MMTELQPDELWRETKTRRTCKNVTSKFLWGCGGGDVLSVGKGGMQTTSYRCREWTSLTILIFFNKPRSVPAFLVFGLKPMGNDLGRQGTRKQWAKLQYNFRRRRRFNSDNMETEYMNPFRCSKKIRSHVSWGITI